jgi:type IX secretion system PorP/SprF family membrane protein
MRYTILLILFFPLWLLAQQVPHTTAFNSTYASWNPAMTAPWSYVETQAVYHQQWMGFAGAPQTVMADIQVPILDYNMSAGLQVQNDQAGPLRQTSISLLYAYQIKLDYNHRLAIGVMANLSQFGFNGNDLAAYDLDDQLLGEGESTVNQTNFGVGVYYTGADPEDYEESYLFAGLSAQQVIPGSLRFAEFNETTNFKRVLHGFGLVGYHFDQRSGFIEPSLQVLYATNNIMHFQLGLQYEMYDTFWTGLTLDSSFRTGVQLGYIVANVGAGSLRLGTMASYNISSRGQEQGVSLQALVGYRYAL